MIFSIIVPFLNEERYISQCIASLLDQDFDKSEYEIIFIDNGSTDGSVGIIQRFRDVKLLYESKKGSYAARNKGVKAARGEIIAFTDADCVVSKNWLSQIFHCFRETDAAIVLGKRCFFYNSSYWLGLFEEYENTKVEYILSNRMRSYYFGYTNNMAVKAEIFDKVGLFVEWQRGGDTEFIHRCISKLADSRMVFLDKMKIIHLEIATVKDWLKKLNIYGQTSSVDKIKTRRHPDCKMLFRFYARCVKKNKYTFSKKAALFFLLAIAGLYYRLGRFKNTRQNL